MRLSLPAGELDLAARVLLVAVVGPVPDRDLAGAARRAEAEGADLVDVMIDSADGPTTVGSHVATVRSAVAVPVMVCTADPRMAAAACAAGASVVHDLGHRSSALLEVVAGAGVAYVVGHTDRSPHHGAVVAALERRLGDARQAGIARERLMVDPGLDRGTERDLTELKALERPVLVSLSPVDSPGELDHLSLATLAVAHGTRLLRTTDLRPVRRVCDVLSRILAAS